MTTMLARELAKADSLPYVTAQINYAGDIVGRARFDLVDPSRMNLKFESHEMKVRDVRPVRDQFSLDVEGFTYIKCPSKVADTAEMREQNLVHQMGSTEINRQYLEEVASRLQALTGAREILAAGAGSLIVRTTGGSKRQSWAGPASFVHLDYVKEAAEMFLQAALDDTEHGIKPFSRFVIYQTWRAISPGPQPNTLAICDGRSVAGSDAQPFDNLLGPTNKPGNEFTARIARWAPSHRWYYLSNMEADDLLVFKGFDSADPTAMNAMHTAFDNPEAGTDAPRRESLEARFFAFYD